MATVASLVVNIGADTADLKRNVSTAVTTLNRIETSTSRVNARMVAFGAAIGSAVGVLAVTAIKKLGREVIQLSTHGIKLAPVVTAFEDLSASIGETSDAMLSSVRVATKGLITDLDIMAASNKAILLGLPVTAGEMGTLAEAAVALGRAMNQDAGKSLDDLIIALGRSSPLILDNLGLTVKVGEANKAYAREVGKSVSKLTDAEKKLAFYTASMEAARRKTEELGGIHLTLKDQIERVKVQFTNFTDGLGVAIARSPVLAAAFGNVADMLEGAFGGNQVARIQTLIGIVNNFAIGVVSVAQTGVTAIGFLNQGWQALRMAVLATLSVITLIGKAFAELVALAANLATKVPLLGSAFDGVAASARSAADFVGGMQQSLHDQAEGALQGALGNSTFQDSLDSVSVSLEQMRGRMVAASQTIVGTGEIAESLTRKLGGVGDGLDGAGESADKASKATGVLRNTLQDLASEYQSIVGPMAIVDNAQTRLTQGWLTGQAAIAAMAQSAREGAEELAAFQGIVGPALITDTKSSRAVADKGGGFFTNLIEKAGFTTNTITQLFSQAFTGGGGALGAIRAFATQGVSALLGMLPAVGPFIQGLAGPIVAGFKKIGSAIGGLFGFGMSEGRRQLLAANEQIRAMQAELLATHGSIAGIIEAGGAAGLELANAWGSQNVEGLEHFRNLVDEFNASLRETEQAARDAFTEPFDALEELQAQIANTQSLRQFEAAIDRARRTGEIDFQALIRIVQSLQGTFSDDESLRTLARLISEAANSGIMDFERMDQIIKQMIAQWGKGVSVPINFAINGSPMSSSTAFKLAGETAFESFIRRNPGDEHRFEGAFTEEERRDFDTRSPDELHRGGIVDFAKWQRAHRGALAFDEVPAILQTGEGVISRRGMVGIGRSGLEALNQGRTSGMNAGVESRLDRLTAEMGAQRADMSRLLRDQPRQIGLALQTALLYGGAR